MRCIAALLGLLLLLAGTLLPEMGHAGRLEWTVRYQGHNIRVHVITPNKPGPWPLALILHGASGVGRGHMYWPMAEELADRGIAAAVVRYYDGLSARIKRKQSPRIFSQREKILDHIISNLMRRKQVKGDVIGVYGYSLGGFHTMALAARDARVAAGVSLAGGLSGHIPHEEVKDAAPLLLIHGTRDRIVPYRRSVIARSAWRKSGQSANLIPLNGVGHVPYGKTRARAFVVAADFIEEHLMAAILPPIPRARPVIPVPRTPPPARELAKAR